MAWPNEFYLEHVGIHTAPGMSTSSSVRLGIACGHGAASFHDRILGIVRGCLRGQTNICVLGLNLLRIAALDGTTCSTMGTCLHAACTNSYILDVQSMHDACSCLQPISKGQPSFRPDVMLPVLKRQDVV